MPTRAASPTPRDSPLIRRDISIHKDVAGNERFRPIENKRTLEEEGLDRALTLVSESTMNGLNIYMPLRASPDLGKGVPNSRFRNNDVVTESPSVGVPTMSSISQCASSNSSISNTSATSQPSSISFSRSYDSIPRSYQQSEDPHISLIPRFTIAPTLGHSPSSSPTNPRSHGAVPTREPPPIPRTQSISTSPTDNMSSGPFAPSITRKISSQFGPTVDRARNGRQAQSSEAHNPPIFQYQTSGGDGQAFGTQQSYAGSDQQRSTLSIGASPITSQRASPAGFVNSPEEHCSAGPVGGGRTGKSGEVIAKLQRENHAYKKEVAHQESLLAEMRRELSLKDEKADAIKAECEMELHEATINKTLLKRRERKIEDLSRDLEAERRRAAIAEEREQNWRVEVERVTETCTKEVAEAEEREARMDAGYKVISTHWPQQKTELERQVAEMTLKVAEISRVREEDAAKWERWARVSEQKEKEVERLVAECRGRDGRFEEYKRTDEAATGRWKKEMQRKEGEADSLLKEAREKVEKLSWALSVKRNVKWVE